MTRRVAIVGGNGFVGSRLIEEAQQAGWRALGFVRTERGAVAVQARGGDAVVIEVLSSDALEAMSQALEGTAALVYTGGVSADSERTNPSALETTIEACRRARVPHIAFLSGLGIANYGKNVHCTNSYFLAKMAGEVALLRSGLRASVFRPSYIFGPADSFLTPLIERVREQATIEIPGDGSYRMQPISVDDAARAILGEIVLASEQPRVIDLVGDRIISYRGLVEGVARALGRDIQIVERPMEEALARATSGGYFGLRSHDLACLLCDEVSDSSAVEALVQQPLETLDDMIRATATTALAR